MFQFSCAYLKFREFSFSICPYLPTLLLPGLFIQYLEYHPSALILVYLSISGFEVTILSFPLVIFPHPSFEHVHTTDFSLFFFFFFFVLMSSKNELLTFLCLITAFLILSLLEILAKIIGIILINARPKWRVKSKNPKFRTGLSWEKII